ncbi:MAG: hypothetical protein Q4C04_00350 [Clostridia bacterium]|nr:hypothetical protein [Clostridia bacterium]
MISELIRAVEAQLETKPRVIVGIDGGAASGKTTLAATCSEALGATLIHMDDYFLPPALRTPAREAEIGGNVHYERFYDEIVARLEANGPLLLRRYDCHLQAYQEARLVEPAKAIIIEGCYSLHPRFRHIYDIMLVLSTDVRLQRERLLKREGEKGLKAFETRWIPLENAYLNTLSMPRDKIAAY